MRKYIFLVAIFFLFLENSLSQETDIQTKRQSDSIYTNAIKARGVKIIPIRNKKYKVWTKKSGTGKIKLFLLHGGPGTSPEYFENFPSKLGKNYTIYFYSQLGSYFSDIPKDSTLYMVESFVNDIEEVRQSLDLEQFYILGHSWGNQLAQAYAVKYPEYLKGLLLCNNINEKYEVIVEHQTQLYANILEDIPEYAKYADSLRFGFSGKFSDFSSPDALGFQIRQKAWPIMLEKHYARLVGQMPKALRLSKEHSTGRLMSELGFMQRIDSIDFNKYLIDIKTPTLFIGGKYDFIPSSYYVKMRDRMVNNQNVDIYICPNGSHFTMWDDQDNFFQAVDKFILKIEKSNPK
ncbi:proline iminopeptidase-family hydrolase [Flavobacterium pectinovorum]|uniref:proline iminopeptidase-family hydrolase n=1 Tax=Flavobacterium pectinovorum TaxID=29533 RepID=UPI001FAB5124|nr:proline iminopeptidase-family hydrolase [Flavobacterium pectinovorum]MCI9844515.1 proline iminopeptidase-family hydrolase [Flavobacterium pectinovorum]